MEVEGGWEGLVLVPKSVRGNLGLVCFPVERSCEGVCVCVCDSG